jgi:hypothetical protein
MKITDPKCSGDIRIQFEIKIEKFVGKFVYFTSPDPGDSSADIMSFLKWGHIFTNMAGMEKMKNTKLKDQ